jgi:hypothetical protein
MGRDKFTCQSCRDALSTLNVHHRYYEKGKSPWEYPESALVTLCEKCHERIEARVSYINKAIHGTEYRQSRFLWLLNADIGEGPFENPCFNWTVEHLAQFLQAFEGFIADSVEDADQLGDRLSELKSLAYEVIRGIHSAIEEASRTTLEKRREPCESDREIGPPDDGVPKSTIKAQGGDGEFWAALLAQVRDKRPLTLHWVESATLLDVSEGSIKLGFSEDASFCIEALSRSSTMEFLEGVCEAIKGRKLRVEMVVLEQKVEL